MHPSQIAMKDRSVFAREDITRGMKETNGGKSRITAICVTGATSAPYAVMMIPLRSIMSFRNARVGLMRGSIY
jgi:hypothetical protein